MDEWLNEWLNDTTTQTSDGFGCALNAMCKNTNAGELVVKLLDIALAEDEYTHARIHGVKVQTFLLERR